MEKEQFVEIVGQLAEGIETNLNLFEEVLVGKEGETDHDSVAPMIAFYIMHEYMKDVDQNIEHEVMIGVTYANIRYLARKIYEMHPLKKSVEAYVAAGRPNLDDEDFDEKLNKAAGIDPHVN